MNGHCWHCDGERIVRSLRGLEGKGAAVWFGALRETLEERWGFRGRRRTPPPDPVNAMLSLAYTILYHHASASIVAAGLNPRIGVFHRYAAVRLRA